MADRGFNRAALHPADPIKCQMSTQRTQTPDRRQISLTNEPPLLDPLENAIGRQLVFRPPTAGPAEKRRERPSPRHYLCSAPVHAATAQIALPKAGASATRRRRLVSCRRRLSGDQESRRCRIWPLRCKLGRGRPHCSMPGHGRPLSTSRGNGRPLCSMPGTKRLLM